MSSHRLCSAYCSFYNLRVVGMRSAALKLGLNDPFVVLNTIVGNLHDTFVTVFLSSLIFYGSTVSLIWQINMIIALKQRNRVF